MRWCGSSGLLAVELRHVEQRRRGLDRSRESLRCARCGQHRIRTRVGQDVFDLARSERLVDDDRDRSVRERAEERGTRLDTPR